MFNALVATAFSSCCGARRPGASVLRGQLHTTAAASQNLPRALASCTLVHSTSVAIIPPAAAWPQIQAVRELVRDRGLWRWPPHANLLYPFATPSLFEAAAPALADALAGVPPFEVELLELRLFVHSARSATLWLHPEPSRPGALIDLEAALVAALPHCDAQLRDGVFTAHFTVGHFEGEAAALSARDAILASGWEGVRFGVDEVCMMRRDDANGQFEPAVWVPLGLAASAAGGRAPRGAAAGERFAGMPLERAPFTLTEKRPKRGKKPKPATSSQTGAGDTAGAAPTASGGG